MLDIQLPEKQLFPLGMLTATPGALKALGDTDEERSRAVSDLISRHAAGEPGELNEHDAAVNLTAIRDGTRILSSYRIDNDTVVWIITEADRSATTLLLPEEY